MKSPSYKRRRVWVDKHVQGALARRIMLHWICFMSLSVTITCMLTAIANFDKLSLFESVFISLKEQAGTIVVLFAFLPWFLRDAMELSHRFAGPMVRLRHAMRGLANGEEIPPVVFRKGDFWTDVADEMNRVRELVLISKAQKPPQAAISEPAAPKTLNPAVAEPVPTAIAPVMPLSPMPGSSVTPV